jgi:hypothetical protein
MLLGRHADSALTVNSEHRIRRAAERGDLPGRRKVAERAGSLLPRPLGFRARVGIHAAVESRIVGEVDEAPLLFWPAIAGDRWVKAGLLGMARRAAVLAGEHRKLCVTSHVAERQILSASRVSAQSQGNATDMFMTLGPAFDNRHITHNSFSFLMNSATGSGGLHSASKIPHFHHRQHWPISFLRRVVGREPIKIASISHRFRCIGRECAGRDKQPSSRPKTILSICHRLRRP